MTNKNGYFNITPKLTDYDRFYLHNFHVTQHFKRNTIELQKQYNGSHGYNGEYGEDGELFINHITDYKGNIINKDIVKINTIISFKEHPKNQPSIDCPWKPNKDGTKLICENNYNNFNYHIYGWIKWLIKYIFKDKYKLNGKYILKIDNNEKIITIKNNDINFYYKKGNLSNNNKLIIQSNKTKTNHEILYDIINKTKNKDIIWKKDQIISYNTKYVTYIDLGSGVKIYISLFIKEYRSKNNYISIYIKKGKSFYFYRNIKIYNIKELEKIVEKKHV